MKDTVTEIGWVGPGGTTLDGAVYGLRAARLARAAAVASVPPALVLPEAVLAEVRAKPGQVAGVLAPLEAATGRTFGCPERPLLLAVRPPEASGGVSAVLDLGVTPATLPALIARHGARVAQDLYRRAVQSYATAVLGIEAEAFEGALFEALKASGTDSEEHLSAEDFARLAEEGLALIAEEGCALPDDPQAQLSAALDVMAAAWARPSARRRRTATGQGEAPLALIVQAMALGLGDHSGAGTARARCEDTGAPGLDGRYLPEAQGDEAMMGLRTPWPLVEGTGAPGASLTAKLPAVAAALCETLTHLERAFEEALAVEFTVENAALHILDIRPQRRSARAAVRIAVDLAEAGITSRARALASTDPAFLDQHLHPTIAPNARRDRIGRGLPASPGAASGPLAFSPEAAERAAAEGAPAILALVETSPEDIRGMHAAAGVLTVRGGMTSHAAVVARGLGRPCVVGARDLSLDPVAGRLSAADGRSFGAGDAVSVDGSQGTVLAGTVETRPPEITGAFATLMDWADATRRLDVRANADTAKDAMVATGFNAAGIGLCRTEHMFFERGRIAAMREMILAEDATARRAALERLRPMQREDFSALFAAMAGKPVTIRLLDPPLHEFLPHGQADLAEVAERLGLPVERVEARAADLAEFNPMLGKRGCRIAIAYPEIYQMQAHALFEAAASADPPVHPEIMVPLVSAVRELQAVRAMIDEVARDVAPSLTYSVGVMIETPRACLRAGDIAAHAEFLSFGTNDLTQMLYGLSRDDAGRFMPEYVAKNIFAHDPFHRIDEEGVGEIIRLAIERARAVRPEIAIGLCGEHGGDPASIDFCERAGFDYVSCSPYRVPIARLAAAQARLRRDTAG
ncbi:MAG: pyruvate, phosphate dikinase [Pseudomonadota bacterium]